MNPFRQINLQELSAKQKKTDEAMRDTPVSKTQEEELVGKQHKIDKNKNGKVDAHDFKLLRKEDHIDELSKSTLDSYREKAFRDQPSTRSDNPAKYDKRKAGRSTAFDKVLGRKPAKEVKEENEIDEKLNVGGGAPVKGPSGVVSNTPPKKKPDGAERAAGTPTSAPKKPVAPVKPQSALDKIRASMKNKMKEDVSFDEGMDRQARERAANEAERKAAAIANNPKIAAEVERRKKAAAEANKKQQANEETEQIDELDKKTLASYAYKAANQAADKTGEYEKRMNSADAAGARAKDGKLAFAKDANKAVQQHSVNKAKEARAVASKRLSGLNKAVSKLAFKEDKDKDEKEKDDKDDKYEDRISRSDYKVNASGRKSHKEIVFGTKMKEQAPVAPGLDKKYIKGTTENKAARAASKPINGIPTNKESYDDNRRGFGKRPREDDEYHIPDPTVKKTKVKKEEVELHEANHREFASQGKMHPDMAKNMSVGSEHDYYEPKTGDKVSGKVIKKSATEVHMKQTHDSYDPKKTGTMHKFAISSKLDEGSVPFDGPYTKTKPVKNSDGTMQSPMSRARELAKQAMAKKKTNEELDLEEKIDMKKASMGDVIKDFKASDAPQFKGKSDEKRREMAVAAKLSAQQNEELHMHSFKSYIQEDMDESMFPGSPEYKAKFGDDKTRGKVGSSSKTSMGTQTVTGTGVKHERDYDKAEKQSSAPASGEKRGRGRPAGAASGARQKGSAVKSDDRYDSTGYKLHLPVRK